MTWAQPGRTKKDNPSYLPGLPARHMARLCRDHEIRTDSDGRPDLDTLAFALSVPELRDLLASRRRIFMSLKEAARLLGASPRTAAASFGSSGQSSVVRMVSIAPRIRYVLAPDIDRVLFGEASEIANLGSGSEPAADAPMSAGEVPLSGGELDLLAEDIAGLVPEMKVPWQVRKK